MPVTLSDPDIAELNRLLQRFRLDAMQEVQAISVFLNEKIKDAQTAQRQAAITTKVADAIEAEAIPVSGANGHAEQAPA